MKKDKFLTQLWEKKWFRIPDNHPWENVNLIGLICSVEPNGITKWFSTNGHEWRGAISTPIQITEMGYKSCKNEKEAKSFLEKCKEKQRQNRINMIDVQKRKKCDIEQKNMANKIKIEVYTDNGVVYTYRVNNENDAKEQASAICEKGYQHNGGIKFEFFPVHRILKVNVINDTKEMA